MLVDALLLPLFLDTAFGKTIFVLAVFGAAMGILFTPHAEYLLSLALLIVLGWAVDILGPHPMLAVLVLTAAGFGRIVLNTGEWFRDANAETQAMVLAFVDELLDFVGADRREND